MKYKLECLYLLRDFNPCVATVHAAMRQTTSEGSQVDLLILEADSAARLRTVLLIVCLRQFGRMLIHKIVGNPVSAIQVLASRLVGMVGTNAEGRHGFAKACKLERIDYIKWKRHTTASNGRAG